MKNTCKPKPVNSKLNNDELNEQILENLVEQIAVFIENADIPNEAWEKALDELAERGKSDFQHGQVEIKE
ncbi:MAG: hypothetical protein ACOYL3_14955 [Desulfuromonadaceae bacterium]